MSEFTTPNERTSLADDPEADLVREIEAAVGHSRCHGWPGAQVSAKRIASAGLGGDFHNVISGLDGRYSLVAGTVTGPGLFAAFAKTVLSGTVQKFGRVSPEPQAMMNRIVSLLDRINTDLRDHRVVCSAFHALVDPARGTLEYCNAGRCQAFAWTPADGMYDLRSTGPALGARGNLEFDCESLDIGTSQRLIILSEGLANACSAAGDSFGMLRARRLITDTVRLPPDEQVDAIVRTVREHVGPDNMLTEDVTVFITEFGEDVSRLEVDSANAWLQACVQHAGAPPDSSIYLG